MQTAKKAGLESLPPDFRVIARKDDYPPVRAHYLPPAMPTPTDPNLGSLANAKKLLEAYPGVKELVKGEAAKIMAADMLYMKEKYPQLDAGYFANVYLFHDIWRAAWRRYRQANAAKYDKGLAEIKQNFGRLMTAMDAL
jgi:hypothetical protein